MDRSTKTPRSPLVRPVGFSTLLTCALLISLASCGTGDTVEITSVRRAPSGASFKRVGASSSERFGGGPPPEASTVAPSGLTYDVPAGWKDIGGSSMRIVNLTAPGQSQCYVVRLIGEAGGRAANLNRWRGEVGLDAAEDAELDALPTVEFLGRPCSLLEVTGDYAGMGGQAGTEMTLLGVVRIGVDSSLFVKMVGPKDAIAAEKQRFLEFVQSVAGA